MQSKLARIRGEGFGESLALAGIAYHGERVSLREDRKKVSPEVSVGGVAPPRKALTSEAAGSRVRPSEPEKWL